MDLVTLLHIPHLKHIRVSTLNNIDWSQDFEPARLKNMPMFSESTR